MTAARPAAERGRPPLVPAAAVTALVAAVAAALAVVRPWGDTGVTTTGGFDDAIPVGVVVLLVAAALVAAAAVAAALARRVAHRVTRWTSAVSLALGLVALAAVLAVTSAQVLPRDGGWWGVVASAAAVATGALLLAADLVPTGGPRLRWVTRSVAVVVPLALVVTGGVVAPGWAGHVVDGTYPDTFSESPGPVTVTRIGWRQALGEDTTAGVVGGRLVVVEAARSGGRCRITVRALDLGTGRPVWSSARDRRCDGPEVAAVDGDNTVVRVVLRGPPGARTSAATMLYLGTVDGREVHPSAALDRVQWWTEGFGLVADADTVRGLDPRTGVTTWSREIPRCDDGARASLSLPSAPPAGADLELRTPYDALGAVPGTQHVAATGRDVVLALQCGTSPRVWVVDVIGAVDDDRVVTLPVTAPDGGDAGATTFLPWLDTVVAVVPTAADADGRRDTVTLVGLTLASGSVAWIRPVGQVLTTDVSPVDGSVRVTARADPSAPDTATVLDVRDGAVRSTAAGSGATVSLALTAARLAVRWGAVAVEAADGGVRTGDVPSCVPALAARLPNPLLAGPGGVALVCATGSGTEVLGLVP